MKTKKILNEINRPKSKKSPIIIILYIWLAFISGFMTGRLSGQTRAEVLKYVDTINQWYDIPEYILPAMIMIESSFNQQAVSHKGAVGLLQVTVPAYEDYSNRNPVIVSDWITNFEVLKTDWKANLCVGAWYLVKVCHVERQTWKGAISSYFWGAYNTNINFYDNIYLTKVESKIDGDI